MTAATLTAGCGSTCDGACPSCGGLAERVTALEEQIAKLMRRGMVDEADPLLGAREVAGMIGLRGKFCLRTLNRRVAKKTFPPPDHIVPGTSHRMWKRSTVLAWLAQQVNTPRCLHGAAARRAKP